MTKLNEQISYMPYGIKAGIPYKLNADGTVLKRWYRVATVHGKIKLITKDKEYRDPLIGTGYYNWYSMYGYVENLDKQTLDTD